MLTIEALKQYGADAEVGLARCINNESLYLRLVGQVAGNDNFVKLVKAIENNNYDDAFQAAHGLKGIVTNLSLTPLEKPICEITELLRNKTDVDYSSLLEEIETQRKRLGELM